MEHQTSFSTKDRRQKYKSVICSYFVGCLRAHAHLLSISLCSLDVVVVWWFESRDLHGWN